jgi:hypothetical protein
MRQDGALPVVTEDLELPPADPNERHSPISPRTPTFDGEMSSRFKFIHILSVLTFCCKDTDRTEFDQGADIPHRTPRHVGFLLTEDSQQPRDDLQRHPPAGFPISAWTGQALAFGTSPAPYFGHLRQDVRHISPGEDSPVIPHGIPGPHSASAPALSYPVQYGPITGPPSPIPQPFTRNSRPISSKLAVILVESIEYCFLTPAR